ncbi:MAG: discoidin domain-containing protein [Nibricoccus sp.]
MLAAASFAATRMPKCFLAFFVAHFCFGTFSARAQELTPQSYGARGDYAAGGEGIPQLFDGQTATKWLDFSSASWVSITFASAKSVSSYSITSANDAPERDPISWTLSGSNDGTNWTTIETRSAQSWGGRFLTRVFNLAIASDSYTHFRFDLQCTSGPLIQLAELKLFGSSGSDLGNLLTPLSYAARGDYAAGGEGIVQLFDGQTSTKWLDQTNVTWIKVIYASPVLLRSYFLTSANDYPGRDPGSWTLYGSNDGVSWTMIETRSGQSWSNRFLPRLFTLSAPAAYTQFRFDLQAISEPLTQLAEMELYGTASASGAPVVTTQPVSVSVMAGQPASFSVQASGSGLGYQWRKNGAPISGAIASTFAIAAVGAVDAGNYSVVVSNASGSVVSAAASLNVTTNQSPAVVLTAPTQNSDFTLPVVMTLTAAASDPDGSISKVEFFNEATKLGEDATAPYGLSWSPDAPGTAILTAKATDNQGAITSSTAVSVRLLPSLPYIADFEASEGYALGSLNNQKGWSVTAGSA